MVKLRGGKDLNYIKLKRELMKEVKLTTSICSNPIVVGLKVGIKKKFFISTCIMVICEYVFHHVVCKFSNTGSMAGLCDSLGT